MAAPAHIFKTARRQLRKIRHRGATTDTEKRLLASADQQRSEGLGWRYDGFSGMSDAQLFEALARVSLDMTRERFLAEAEAAPSPSQLAASWETRAHGEGKWKDLPMLAARELWRRLMPHRRTPEIVADEVDELLEEAEVAADRATLLVRAARLLIEGCGANSAQFQAVQKESGSDLLGFMQELPASLLETAHKEAAPELCLGFAGFVDAKMHLAERAEMLARLGKREEALAQLEPLVEQHPTDPLVMLKAGATYEALGEIGRSQAFYRRYSDVMADPKSAPVIAAANKAGALLPKRSAIVVPRAALADGDDSTEQVGANDPCPCGSGRKWKKCHGLPV